MDMITIVSVVMVVGRPVWSWAVVLIDIVGLWHVVDLRSISILSSLQADAERDLNEGETYEEDACSYEKWHRISYKISGVAPLSREGSVVDVDPFI